MIYLWWVQGFRDWSGERQYISRGQQHTVSFIQAVLWQVAWEGRSFPTGPPRQHQQGHCPEKGKGKGTPWAEGVGGAHVCGWYPLSSKVWSLRVRELHGQQLGPFMAPELVSSAASWSWVQFRGMQSRQALNGYEWAYLSTFKATECVKNVRLALVGFGLMTPTCCEEIKTQEPSFNPVI